MVRTTPRSDAEARPAGARARTNSASTSWVESTPVLAALVLSCYLLASALVNPAGYMGSDTGGKTATVSAMSERGDWSPDIGYWAAEWDSEGELHPYFGTVRRGDAFVQVTSLPMILTARPLWDLGGPRAALLLPMVGATLAALAAGHLSLIFGARRRWPAVLTVGLASPVAVYALDFWEHSIGLAAMGWAYVGLLRVLQDDGLDGRSLSLRTKTIYALGCGLGFGLAANLRQEALIYGFVAGVFLFVGLYSRRDSVRSWLTPTAFMALGTVVMLGANFWLEQSVYGEAARTSRSAGALSAAGSSGVVLRATEAIVTFASPVDHVHWSAVLLAALVAVGLVWASVAQIQSSELTRPLALIAVAVLALVVRLIAFGPGFVSGMLATAPLAGAGIAVAMYRKHHAVLALALVPLPLVWSFQYTRAAAPQWGGRYILASGLLLVAFVLGQRAEFGQKFERWIRTLALAGAAMTLLGVAFLHQRTNSFAEASQYLADRPEAAMIFDDPFLPREAGPAGVHENWLAANTREERAQAAQIVVAAGLDSFVYVGNVFDGEIEFDGFIATSSEEVTFFEHTREVKLTSYVLAG